MKSPPLRIGVLGSGKGTNFRAIADAIAAGTLNAEIALVLSDFQDAGIIALARERGYAAQYIPPGKLRTKLDPEVEAWVADLLRAAGVELVVLAGYMRMVKEPLLKAFPGRIINMHPSLLPLFPGLDAWRQAINSGVSESGCTVHYVDDGMDTGPLIAQRRVPVLPGDTPESLHARIQVQEHELYPQVIGELAAKLRAE